MRVLMLGVDSVGKGGMWTVARNYLSDRDFCGKVNLTYIPTASAGSIPRRLMIFAKGLLRIRKELRSRRYDIVHMHLSERGSLYRKNIVQGMAKRAGCKTILHLHGADFEEWYRASGERQQRLIRGVVSRADRVLILGRYWEPFVSGLMDDNARLSLLYNAVEVPQENRYNTDSRNILFLGAMIERKGILDLLAAMAKLRSELPEGCRLILCGDDPDGIAVPEIERLQLQDLVELKGWIGAEETERVLAASAVNVLPSYREGLPMTILEAMAHGVPSISTSVAAIPEAIDSGENGLLIELGNVEMLADAILTLLRDPGLRARLSDTGWHRMRNDFSLDAHKARLIEIYASLLAREAGDRA